MRIIRASLCRARQETVILILLLATSAPGTLARADSPPPAPPTPEMEQKTLRSSLSENERKYIYEGLEKSEYLAGTLGVVLGFGAGAFYGNSPEWGIALMTAEFATLGGWVAFGGSSSNNPMFIGVLLAERIVGGLAGVLTTSEFNEELRRASTSSRSRRGISFAPQVGPGGGGFVAAYTVAF